MGILISLCEHCFIADPVPVVESHESWPNDASVRCRHVRAMRRARVPYEVWLVCILALLMLSLVVQEVALGR